MPDTPLVSLVVSTIGRPVALARFLDSLGRQPDADRIELVVVDQSPDQACAELVRTHTIQGPWTVTTSGRGASVGRNEGLRSATAPVVAFPDDNCWYAPDTITRVLAALEDDPGLCGVSARQATVDGRPSMLRWLAHPTTVTRSNFMRTTICSTLFLRRHVLDSVGPFDESIGVGSSHGIGAGEESDLVLRVLANGGSIAYRPDITVFQDDDREAITVEFVDKMLRYGVGNGHLWRRHGLSRRQLAYYSARKLAGAGVRAVSGRSVLARSDIAYLRGTVAGWRGTAP